MAIFTSNEFSKKSGYESAKHDAFLQIHTRLLIGRFTLGALLPDNNLLSGTARPSAHSLELLLHQLAVFVACNFVALGRGFYHHILAGRFQFGGAVHNGSIVNIYVQYQSG